MLRRLRIIVALLSGKADQLNDDDLRLLMSRDQRTKLDKYARSHERAEAAKAAVERRIADLEEAKVEMRSLRRECPQTQDPYPVAALDWLLNVALIVLLVVLITIVYLYLWNAGM